MKIRQSKKVELAIEVINDWQNSKISAEQAMGRMWLVFMPQSKLTKEQITFGKGLTKKIMTEKTLVKGKNCEFLLDPKDYPGLTFAIPSGMIEDRPPVEIPEIPSLEGCCKKNQQCW